MKNTITNNNPYDFSILSKFHKEPTPEEIEMNKPDTSGVYNFEKVFNELNQKEQEEVEKIKNRNNEYYSESYKERRMWTHPNDPSVNEAPPMFGDYRGAKYVKDMYVDPRLINRPKTPYQLQLEEINRQQGQAYLNQRNYDVGYNFRNRRDLNWIKRYQSSINKEMNDPNYVTKQYWPNPPIDEDYSSTGGIITPDFKTKEDEWDQYYYTEAKSNEAMAKLALKKQKESGLKAVNSHRPRQMGVNEYSARMKSVVTPSIDPAFLRNMPSDLSFGVNECETVLHQLKEAYGEYYANILMGRLLLVKERRRRGEPDIIPGEPKSKAYQQLDNIIFNELHLPERINAEKKSRETYTVDNWKRYNDYKNSSNQAFLSKQYTPGYGYCNTLGKRDEYGLPIKWFDDRWLWLTPTKEEIDAGEVVGIKLYRNGKLIGGNGVERKPEIKTPENEECVVRFVRTNVNEDGTKEYDVYDATHNHHLTKEEVHEYFNREANKKSHHYNGDDYKFASIGMSSTPSDYKGTSLMPDFSRYTNMIKSAQEQLDEDDTVKLTTELARYNKFVADNYMWFSTILEGADLKSLKEVCQSQLVFYREKDPFAFIKSTVLIVGDKIVWSQPKPTTLEEIDKLRKECTYDVSGLDDCKTLEDKVKYLQTMKYVGIIPKEEDDAYKYISKLIPLLNKVQGTNQANYQIYKNFMRNSDKDPLTFEERFYKWWMMPREKMTEKEYRKKYIDRMTDAFAEHMDFIYKNAIPYEEVVNRRIKAHNDFLIKLTHGKINNMQTFEDSDAVANAIINYHRYVARRAYARSNSINTNCKPCSQLLTQKELFSNTYCGGLEEKLYETFGGPIGLDNGNYDKPVQINSRLPREERAQDYIQRILEKNREKRRMRGF